MFKFNTQASSENLQFYEPFPQNLLLNVNHLYFSYSCSDYQPSADVWYSGKRSVVVDYSEPGNEEPFLVPRSSMPPRYMMNHNIILENNPGSINDLFHSTQKDALPEIDGIDWEKCFVHGSGAPLISYLAKDIEDHAGNGYAVLDKPYLKTLTNAGVDLPAAAKVETRSIGLFDSDKEAMSFINWCQQNYDADQEKFPSGMLNVTMSVAPITKDYYEKILRYQRNYTNPNPFEGPALFGENADGTPDEVHLIQDIYFGNGISWCAKVNLGLESVYHTDGTFNKYAWCVNKLHTDNKIIKFLLKFKFYVGTHLPTLILGLERQMREMYKVYLRMPQTVSIDALTATAGWQADLGPELTTNLICNGTLSRNIKGVDDDQMIIADIHEKSVVNAELVGRVRYVHVTTTVLLNIIIRNLFPDPEVCCAILELSQKDWVIYLIDLIIAQIANLELDNEAKEKSVTRGDLLLSLRAVDMKPTDGNVLTWDRTLHKEPLESLRRFSELLPNWPSITHGGPRFLHIVRQCFIQQYEVLKAINHVNAYVSPNLGKEIDQEFTRVTVFDRILSPMPVIFPPVSKPGLVAWPEFTEHLFQVDPGNLATDELFQEAKRINRNVQTGIYEAVRLDPALYSELVQAIDYMDLSKHEFRFWKKVAFYDRLRLCAYRSTGKNVPRSQKMEELIQKKQNFVINEQMQAKNGNFREERKKLCKAQFSRASTDCQKPRTTVQNDIFKIKGDNYEKNKKKRDKMKLKKMGERKEDTPSTQTVKIKVKQIGVRKENLSARSKLKVADLRDALSRCNIGNVKDLRSVINSKSSKADDCHHGGHQPMDVSPERADTEHRTVRRLSSPQPSTSRGPTVDYVWPSVEPMDTDPEED